MSTLSKRKSAAVPGFFSDFPLMRLRQELEDAFGETEFLKTPTELVPSVDISETDNEVRVETNLPGYKPEEVDIEIHDNRLTISGTHTEEQSQEDKDRKYHRLERRSGSFSRTLALPCPVHREGVSAVLKEGVLTIALPKSEDPRRHKVAVKG